MDEETAEALTRTKALYDAGVLTEEEYNSKKNELLNPPPVVVAQPPAIVAQPPANEYGGVVQGHVVTEQPQKVHPEPRPQEDILANYRSNEEASRAATRIQAEARSRAASKDYPLPPGATSATSLQGWWLGLGIGCTGTGAAGEGGGGGVLHHRAARWPLVFQARGTRAQPTQDDQPVRFSYIPRYVLLSRQVLQSRARLKKKYVQDKGRRL